MKGSTKLLVLLTQILSISWSWEVGQSVSLGSGKEEPIKFLVLQKSDIVGSLNETDSSQEDPSGLPTTTEYIFSDVLFHNVETESTTLSPASFSPEEAWKELGFPVVPEDGADPIDSTKDIKPSTPIDLTQYPNVVNITRDVYGYGRVQGRVNCQCGRSRDRIVNGEPARINDIPWTGSLVRKGFFGFGASSRPYCGGSLINNQYIITAAHCVDAQFASGIKVWLNDEDLLITTETPSGREAFDVEKIIMHPGYDRRVVNNDIALIKLAKPVAIDIEEQGKSYVTPVCLPANNDHDFSGLTGTVAGWGTTSQGGSTSSVLRKVDVPIIKNSVCNSDTKYTGKITDTMLCAGFLETGGKDSCQGDSGGPLIIENGGRKTLVGIVSWGYGCAQPKAPGVYTRVGVFPQWILDNTKDAEWCSS